MGNKLVRELSLILTPLTLISTVPSENSILVTQEVLKKITGLPSPEERAALFPLPQESSLTGKRFLLAFDQINDPGNLGTLLRSALALGWEGAIFLPGCVDPFNEKVIRASRGALFRLPFAHMAWDQLTQWVEQEEMTPLIADIEGEEMTTPPSKPLLVLSNEARGVSKQLKNWGKRITIPMEGPMESLNVAVAGSILMHTLKWTEKN